MAILVQQFQDKQKQLEWVLKNRQFELSFQGTKRTFDVNIDQETLEIKSIQGRGFVCLLNSRTGVLEPFPGQKVDPLDTDELVSCVEFVIQVAQTLGLKYLLCKDQVRSTSKNPGFLFRHAYLLMYGRSWLSSLGFRDADRIENRVSSSTRETFVRELSLYSGARDSEQSKEYIDGVFSRLRKATGDDQIDKKTASYIFEVLWKKQDWQTVDFLFEFVTKFIIKLGKSGAPLSSTDPIPYTCDITQRIFYDPESRKISLDEIASSDESLKKMLLRLHLFQPFNKFGQWIVDFSSEGESKVYRLPLIVVKQSANKYVLAVYSDRPGRLDSDPFLDGRRKKAGACLSLEITLDAITNNLIGVYIANINNFSKCANPFLPDAGGGKIMVNFALSLLRALKIPFSTIYDAAELKTIEFTVYLSDILLTTRGLGYYEKFGFVPNVSENAWSYKPHFFEPKVYKDIAKSLGQDIPFVKETLEPKARFYELVEEYDRRGSLDAKKEEQLTRAEREKDERESIKETSSTEQQPEDQDSDFDVSSVSSQDEFENLEDLKREIEVEDRSFHLARQQMLDLRAILVWLPRWTAGVRKYREEFTKDLATKPIVEWIGNGYLEKLKGLFEEEVKDNFSEIPKTELFGQIFDQDGKGITDELIAKVSKQPLSFFVNQIVKDNRPMDQERAADFVKFMKPFYYSKLAYLNEQIIYLGDSFSYDSKKFIEENTSNKPAPSVPFMIEKSPSDLSFAKKTRVALEFEKHDVLSFSSKTLGTQVISYGTFSSLTSLELPFLFSFLYETNECRINLLSFLPVESIPEDQRTQQTKKILKQKKADIALDVAEILARECDIRSLKVFVSFGTKTPADFEILKLLKEGKNSFHERGCIVPPNEITDYIINVSHIDEDPSFHRNAFLDLLVQQTNKDKNGYDQVYSKMAELVSKVTVNDIASPDKINEFTGHPWKSYLYEETALDPNLIREFGDATLKELGEKLFEYDEVIDLSDLISAVFYFDPDLPYQIDFESNSKTDSNLIVSSPITFKVVLFD